MNSKINILLRYLYTKELLLLLCILSFFMFYILWQDEQKNIVDADDMYHTQILLDVSKSMEIRDMPENKSRLEYVKKRLWETLSKYTSLSLGLSIFAWEGMQVLPFTRDKDIFWTFLQSLNSDNLSVQGSRLDLWLLTAIEAFWDDESWEIVIFTDQDSQEILSELSSVKKELQEKNITIKLYAVGSESWAPILKWQDIFWSPIYKKYQWEIVKAPLELAYLRDLSRKLSWNFVVLSEASDIDFSDTSSDILHWSWYFSSKTFFLLISFLFWLLFLMRFYTISFYKKYENTY